MIQSQFKHNKKETSWVLAFIIASVIMLPIWLLWKIIQVVFFSSKNKNK